MRSSGSEVLEELKANGDRKQANFYVSETLLKQFQKACAGVSQSRVVERLMKDFVESVAQTTGKAK